MAVNAVGKRCSEVERAYIAGFLDADGAIMASIEEHQGKRFGFRVRITVKLTQRDRLVLDWMQRKLRIGRVRVNRFNDMRQTFDLHIRDQQDAKELLENLVFCLRVKRRQARIALRILEYPINKKRDLLYVARLADALSRFNVRSKSRRKNYVSKIQEHFSRND